MVDFISRVILYEKLIKLGEFLNNSYLHPDDQKRQIGNFVRDEKISGRRAQVYRNPRTGKVKVVHRGTQGMRMRRKFKNKHTKNMAKEMLKHTAIV